MDADHPGNLESFARCFTLKSKPEKLVHEDVPMKFASLPSYLTSADRALICEMIGELGALRDHALEQARAAKAAKWSAQLLDHLPTVRTLSEQACRELLSNLHARPAFVSPNEFEKLVELKMLVEKRLDELDISALIMRIKAMPTEKRTLLLQMLSACDEADLTF